ncbi:MAG: PIG-L family deacetylase [Stellaceae bacterium]
MTSEVHEILALLVEHRAVEARVTIVVAHPDDETIGMGAQLCRFKDALLLQVTDGAPRDGCDAAAHGFVNMAEYAFARRVELRAALEAGDSDGLRTEMVGIPDQEAYLNLVMLTENLQHRLLQQAPDAVFVQPYEGGHPDHDAVAFAAQTAARLIAAEGRSPPAIIEKTAYHADGPGLATGNFLPADRPATILELSAADRLRKRRMIGCFTSQHDLLRGFDTEVERFREAPKYDFARPPHPGELHYERLGWSVTGELWRRHAREALEALGHSSPRWA